MSAVGVIDKCASILALIAGNALSGAEVCTRLGMSRSTGYRLLQALEEHRFIERGASGDFVLGPFPANRPTADVREVLTAIRNVTGESVQLWMRHGELRACVLSVESLNELRISKSAGSALPLADGGSAALALLGPVDGHELYLTQQARRAGTGSASVAFTAGSEALAVCVSFPLARMPADVEGDIARHLRQAAGVLGDTLPGSEALTILRAVAEASTVQ